MDPEVSLESSDLETDPDMDLLLYLEADQQVDLESDLEIDLETTVARAGHLMAASLPHS